jgi:hypothetical protein
MNKMIETLPGYIPIIFAATTLLTLAIFLWVIRNSRMKSIKENSGKIAIILIAWLSIQAFLTLSNIYNENTNSIPPKIFLFGVLPNALIIIWIFFSKIGKEFIDSLPIEKLTYLNLVRIPVEIVLLWLFLNNTIPQIMTFEGWNFDILMGLTAPIIIYFGFIKRKINTKAILIWNIIGILLLVFVFIIALVSAPFPMQRLSFDQPNTGLLYFPYSWLPTFIVPVVILGHMISIRQLLKSRNIND